VIHDDRERGTTSIRLRIGRARAEHDESNGRVPTIRRGMEISVHPASYAMMTNAGESASPSMLQ
jgi:hypothetical protein